MRIFAREWGTCIKSASSSTAHAVPLLPLGEGYFTRIFVYEYDTLTKPNHPSRLSWAREHLCDRRIYVGDESNDIVCSRPDSSPRTAVPFLMIYTLTRDDMPSLRTQIKKFSFAGTRIFWWRQQNSNLRPLACQASTLTN